MRHPPELSISRIKFTPSEAGYRFKDQTFTLTTNNSQCRNVAQIYESTIKKPYKIQAFP